LLKKRRKIEAKLQTQIRKNNKFYRKAKIAQLQPKPKRSVFKLYGAAYLFRLKVLKKKERAKNNQKAKIKITPKTSSKKAQSHIKTRFKKKVQKTPKNQKHYQKLYQNSISKKVQKRLKSQKL